LQSTFDIKLKLFENWPSFVECSQRRNLVTHCDCFVSNQYLDVCKKEGYKFKDSIIAGDRLEIGIDYLLAACNIMYEVSVKLAHTLWRKIFPDELENSDNHLESIVYELLRSERWDLAQIIGKFSSVDVPKKSNDI